MAKYQFGDNEIDLKDYIHNLENNYSSYIDSRRDWSEGQKQEFRASYEKYLQGLRDQLQNNTNRFRTDSAGSIYDSTGELHNIDNDDIDPVGSEYYYDNKGNRITTDDYNLLKKKKQNKYKTFSANREVATYLQKVGQAIRDKLSPSNSSNTFNLQKHGFQANWKRTNNPAGGEFNFTPYLEKDPVDEATGQRGTANRAAYLKEQIENYIKNIGDYDFSSTPFKDRDTYISRLQAAAKNLENGYNSEDVIALNQAGIGNDFLNNFFATTGQQPKTEAEQAAEDIAREEQRQQEQAIIDQRDQMLYENDRNAFFSNITPFQSQNPSNPLELSYNRQEMEKNAFKKFNANPNDQQSVIEAIRQYINFPLLSDLIRNKQKIKLDEQTDITPQHIANNLDWAAQANLFLDPRYLNEKGESILPNGYYVLPESEDYDNWTYIAYNPRTRQYQEQSMLLNEELLKRMAYPEYDRRNKVQKHQLGGTLKDLQERQAKVQEEEQKEAALKQEAEETSKSVEQIKEKYRKPMKDGFSTIDKIRLTTAAADAAAAAAAFVPGYGTVASGALGLGSTLTNIGVDIADKNVSGWGVLGNAAFGLGMDLVGLIPGYGTAGKGAKAARILKPVSKYVMRALQTYGMVSSANAFNKLMSDPSNMTTDDWKNLATGLQTLSGQARYMGGKRAMNRATTSKEVADVKTSTGEVKTISRESLEKLRKTKGLDSQNKLFSDLTGGKQLQREFKGVEIKWLKPWKSRLIPSGPEVQKRTEASFFKKDKSLDARFLKLVHEKQSKRKTTSRKPKPSKKISKNENGGTLDLAKVRKFEHGGYTLTGGGGVRKKDTYTFDTASRLEAALNRIKNGSMTADDVNQFQRRHYGMYSNWNQSPMKGGDISQYQTDYQGLGLNDEVIAPGFSANYNIQSNNPTSGDSVTRKWNIDGIYDQITDDRRILARASDYEGNQDKLNSDIARAKAAGYDYYLDPETQYYMLRPLASSSETPTGSQPEDKTRKADVVEESQNKKEETPSNFSMKNMLSKLFNNPTITYGLPRAIYADGINRRMTDLAKKSAVPFLKDPFEVHRYTRSDLDEEMQGERNYADLRRLASRPLTSDGHLQAATQLQAEVQGQAARTAGKEKSNQVQRQYDELAWQQEKENAANRHETAMFDRLQQWNTDKVKNAFEQAYLSKKFNNWDVFGQQLEYDARTKQQENKALADNFARSDIHNAVNYSPNDYGANLTPDELTVWNKILSGVNPSSLSLREFNSHRLASQKVSRAETEQLRSYYNIPNTRWSGKVNIATTPWQPSVVFAKNGGIVSAKNGSRIAIAGIEAKTANAERFQRQIKECIDRNEKVLDRLSKSLYGIIKASIIK